jgi:hypothetical protein
MYAEVFPYVQCGGRWNHEMDGGTSRAAQHGEWAWAGRVHRGQDPARAPGR